MPAQTNLLANVLRGEQPGIHSAPANFKNLFSPIPIDFVLEQL
jgi:hypothetical protein